MAISDLATVVESGANGAIIRIDNDGSDSGTSYDALLTGTGGRFPAGDVVRRVREEIDAGHPNGHCGHARDAADRFPGGGTAPRGRSAQRGGRRRTAYMAAFTRTPCATGGFSGRSPEMNQTKGSGK